MQYRFQAHTTADDPTRYRDEEEVEKWKEKDPIPRMQKYLMKTGRLDEELKESIEAKIEDNIKDAVEKAESIEDPEPTDMVEFVYSDLSERLQRQRNMLNGGDSGVREL